MKKIFSILAVSIFTLSFSQTNVGIKSDKAQIEKAYTGGQEKFDQDLSNNLNYTANLYQVNGEFKLNFNVNDGEITDIKLLPELYDRTFEREVKRDVKRLKKRFASKNAQNVSVALSFSRDMKPSDGRLGFVARDPFASQQPSSK